MFAFLLALPLAQAPVVDLIHVPVRSAADLRALGARLRDVDEHHPALARGYAIAYATDAEQAALAAAGLPFTVVTEDLAAWYAARAATEPPPRGGPVGSMGGFRTLAEIAAEMDRLAATHPAIVSPKFQVGTSIQGRPILAMRISVTPGAHDPTKPVAWYDALHHAREPMGGEAVLRFADFLATNFGADTDATRIVQTRNCVFIPCVNPDGYEYNRQTDPNGGGLWRKNRRNVGGGDYGVDLNRNYAWEWGPQWPGSSGNPSSETYRGAAPFSEPETAALRDLLAQQTPGMSMSVHTYSDLLIYSWGYDTIFTPDNGAFRAYSADMTVENGWIGGTAWEVLYIANGVSADWHYGQHGTFAFSPEIGGESDGFWPAPSRIDALAQDAHRPLLRTAQWTGAWLDLLDPVWSEVAGDGDAEVEPGESWDLAFGLLNGGVLGLTGTLNAVPTSADVGVSGGPVAISLAPRTAGTSGALRVDVSPIAAAGAQVHLDLWLDWDGHSDVRPFSFRLGAGRLIARDEMEIGDFGWSASGAANWVWSRSDPEATSNGGVTVQSGDDHSPSGTRAWVTGPLAGGSAGANDVDGTAVLTSPRLQLSEFDGVTLAYWRWFANDPPGGGDDRFLAQASDDDGQTWVTLESAANDAAWRRVEFELDAFINLTDAVRLRFAVADDPNNDLTEGLVDDLELRAFGGPKLALYGPAAAGAAARFFIAGAPGGRFDLAYAFTRTGGTSVPGIAGLFELGSGYVLLAGGNCDAEGLGAVDVSFPPTAAGRTVHFQAVSAFGTPTAEFTNALTLSFP